MAGCRGSVCCCCRWCCCCGERESRTPEELTILGETQEEEDEILPRKDYESLDYDRCINDPYLEVLETMEERFRPLTFHGLVLRSQLVTLMVAKWTGDLFNKGIYDVHIGLRGVPLLEWETDVEMDKLRASDIMEPNLTYVYPHTRIQSLVSILRTTVHHAFPVVTENRGNEKEFMKGNQLISNNIKFKKSSILTRAGEQRKRGQSMKSYPSSELRNVCDEHVASEEPAEKEDLLQQMLERRYTPYPNLYPDQSPSEDWTMEERFLPPFGHTVFIR